MLALHITQHLYYIDKNIQLSNNNKKTCDTYLIYTYVLLTSHLCSKCDNMTTKVGQIVAYAKKKKKITKTQPSQ